MGTELGCQSGPDLLTPVNIVTTITTSTGGQQSSHQPSPCPASKDAAAVSTSALEAS